MTRSLGAGLAADIAEQSATRCQLIFMDWADLANNPTPIYITTAAVDIDWNGYTWEAVGGLMDLDALGESATDPSRGQRLKLSGVNQIFISMILSSRCKGRMAEIYHAGINRTTGAILVDPVLMFKGPMNGGFQVHESRSFGGGGVDVSASLTSRLDELVKVRGIRANEASHRATIPAAAAVPDTFFQNVAQLVLRRRFWGMKTPATVGPRNEPPNPGGITTNPPGHGSGGGGITTNPGGTSSGGPAGGASPWPNVG